MGLSHSRSEDLYKKSILNSESFMGSITDTPGYFSRTVHTLDFVESKFPNKATKTEMSYNGPPSHLQNSIDVHPFWSEFGREYVVTDRFHDMTGGVPRGLLPGTDTAQEMRNLEQMESMQDLRSQVRQKMVQSRPIPEECEENSHRKSASVSKAAVAAAVAAPQTMPVVAQKPAMPPQSNPISSPKESPTDTADSAADASTSKAPSPPEDSIDNDEKLALDFLDSIISESMDMDNDDEVEVMTPKVTEDSNWSLGSESFMNAELRRRNLEKPVPGVMQDVAPLPSSNSHYKSNGNVHPSKGVNVLRTSMYLPDANFMNPHSAAAKTNHLNSLASYRVETADLPSPIEMKSKNRYSTGYLLDRTLNNGDSTVSIDTGIFSDSSSNSASSNGSGVGSRGQGVKNLVKIYNEQTRASAVPEPAWKRHSTNLTELEKGKHAAPPPPLKRSLSQQTSLPLDDSQRVPRNSLILREIRAELQMSLSQ